MKRILIVLFLLALIISIWFVLPYYLGWFQFSFLIHGKICNIKELKIQGVQEINIEDNSLRYIAKELSKGDKVYKPVSAYSFSGIMIFNFFEKALIDGAISEKGDQLIIGYERDFGFYDYYLVPINQNTPAELVEKIKKFIEEGKKIREKNKLHAEADTKDKLR